MTDTADLDSLFGHLSDEGRPRDPNDHPAPEKLSAYLAGELPPGEDDALQEHLTQCTLCADLLLDLQRFLDPPAEDRPREGVVDFETAAQWRELRERMGGRGEREARGGKVSPQGLFGRVFGSLKVAYGLAAVLAVGGVVLSSGFYTELRTPRRAVHLFLPSSIDIRGTEKTDTRVELHQGPEEVSLTLEKSPGLAYPEYLAEIRKAGHLVQVVRHLRYQPREGVSLVMRAEDLEPGDYEIVLKGLRKGRFEVVGKYRLPVVY